MKKFIKSHQVKIINVAFLIGGIFIGSFGYDAYWEYKYISLEKQDFEFIEEGESSILRMIEPSACNASSNLSDSHSCKNLTDNDYTGWKDAGNSCLDETLTFFFDKSYYIEFIVISNFEKPSEFQAVDTIQDFTIYYPYSESGETETNHYLIYDNFEQWIDINKVATQIRLEINSNFDSPETEICGFQEIRFFGKDADD